MTIHKALRRYPCIFQSEIYAIEACALEVPKYKLIGKKIYIISDSLVALKILRNQTIVSKLIWETSSLASE